MYKIADAFTQVALVTCLAIVGIGQLKQAEQRMQNFEQNHFCQYNLANCK